MRIVIDLQGAQASNRKRGIGRYALSLAMAIVRERGEHEVFIVLNGQFPDTIDPIRSAFSDIHPQTYIRVWVSPGPVNQLHRGYDARRKCAELVREAFIYALAPDVVLVTSLFEGLSDDAVTSIDEFSRSVPTAVVLYDLIPLIHHQTYLQNPVVEQWYGDKLIQLRRADLLLSISDSSKREALEHLDFSKDAVVNISIAAEAQFRPAPELDSVGTATLAAHGLVRSFVMYTGGIDPRKNIERLICAYGQLPAALRIQHQLAIVCSIETADRLRLQALASHEGLGITEVVMTGYVSDDDLLTLYRRCKVFIFPSWHEGFGLPALEAMQCGRAVIASNTSSLPEVVGREDALFDPLDDKAILSKLQHVLVDDAFRAQLEQHGPIQAKRFSWNETARRAIAAMQSLDISNKAKALPARPTRRPRLAYFSPLPPEKSGISDYSAELLPVLCRHYDTEVIVEQKEVSDLWINAHCQIRSLAYFRTHSAEYDRVLYHFGNSSFHQHMFELIDEHAGVVVLHDFFLSGVVAHRDVGGIDPWGWARALYRSHGYSAVSERFHAKDTADVVWAYPCNLDVLQRALGVIVHSDYSRRLAQKWYGESAADQWALVPLLRGPVEHVDRAGARKRLELHEEDFVICSFGLLGPSKLNDCLLRSWLSSRLAENPRCRLVFVGQNHVGDYGRELARLIRKSRHCDRITITGWADAASYQDWLAVADVAVQLRTHSRGETSGAVLDCMNCGIATIVNAHGAMADLPLETVVLLPDRFEDAELVQSIEILWEEPDRRVVLGQQARKHIDQNHQPEFCADRYHNAIERFYQPSGQGTAQLIAAIAQAQPRLAEIEWRDMAGLIAKNHPPVPRVKRLFVDISELVVRDAKSGIQRVVRNILREWLIEAPQGYQIEPVFAVADQPGYRCASRFVSGLLGMPDKWAADDWIDACPGDVFLGLDLQPVIVPAQAQTLLELKNRGVGVYFVVYDLLILLMPHAFIPEGQATFQHWLETIKKFDGVACISRAVADELTTWLAENPRPPERRNFKVGWFHLGADVEPGPASGSRANSAAVAELLPRSVAGQPRFLMVGTIEPRKGHAQALEAFQDLWHAGVDANLVIVGKQGWMVEKFIERLQGHCELGRRLHWLSDVRDEALNRLYETSTCLIAASEGEGFGLPLVEAAQHQLPIIARDIPVFREVAGSHAYYFSGSDPHVLAGAVRAWIALHHQNGHPQSGQIPRQTWRQSAAQLAHCLPIHA